MRIFLIQMMGRASSPANVSAVSAQKFQIPCKTGEKPQKYSTAPPAAPNTMKARSSPSPRLSKNRKAAAPAARQYPPSRTAPARGSRSRKGRSTSYAAPQTVPSRMDCRKVVSCCEIWFPTSAQQAAQKAPAALSLVLIGYGVNAAVHMEFSAL